METRPHPAVVILPGRYYSNGTYGRPWGVRQVVALLPDPEGSGQIVDYKGIAGACRRKHGRCSLEEFRRWTRYEVVLNENSWQRVGRFGEAWPDAEG